MKHTPRTLKLISTALLASLLTACGGGGGGGTSSSPEKILENPLVQEALQAAKEHGVDVRTDLGHNPPDLTGYYKRYEGGRVVATESGRSIGNRYVAAEVRIETQGERYDSARVEYANGRPIGYFLSKGAFLRGEGNHFTTYSKYKYTCTEGGSDYHISGIKIISAVRDPQTGSISDRNFVTVRLDFSGELTAACDSGLVGGGKNKWSTGYLASLNKIADASDLNYMCVDDNKAYIPKETWVNSEGQSCKCTTEYRVECK